MTAKTILEVKPNIMPKTPSTQHKLTHRILGPCNYAVATQDIATGAMVNRAGASSNNCISQACIENPQQ